MKSGSELAYSESELQTPAGTCTEQEEQAQ